jgi:phosphatidylglycerophosphate synthase
MKNNLIQKHVVIDCTILLEGELLAFKRINQRFWIIEYLEIIKKAGVNHNTSILVPAGMTNKFVNLKNNYGIQLVENVDNPNQIVLLKIDRVITPSIMVKLLKKGSEDFQPAFIFKITSKEDIKKAEDFIFKDHWLKASRLITMPMAKKLAQLLAKTPITPNAVTTASLIAGLTASLLTAQGTYFYDVLAAVLLQLAFTLDLTDGYLARLTGKTSVFGEWLDTLFDGIINISIILGLLIGVTRVYDSPIWGIFGIMWLLSFQAISNSTWFTRALKLEKEVESNSSIPLVNAKSSSLHSGLKTAVKWVLEASQGFDSKFYIISIALILNLKPFLIVFMGVVNFAAFFLMIYKKSKEL